MSSRSRGPLALALGVFRSEGVHAVVDRTLDRLHDTNRRQSLKRLTRDDVRLMAAENEILVINVSPVPPLPKRGGSQIQMLDRLEREKRRRPVALVYPRVGSMTLEVWTEEVSGVLELDAGGGTSHAVAEAAQLTAANVVHIENSGALPPDLIPRLVQHGLRTVLSVHDFSLFCRRPHLIESTTGRFCEYSTDDERCRACLAEANIDDTPSQEEYRRSAVRILNQAHAVIFPSSFLQRIHHKLFPEGNESALQLVISPSTARSGPPESSTPVSPLSIAFVGGCYEHKGGALIRPIMERLVTERPGITARVFGNGEHELTRQVRRVKGVRVRGYYRQGHLPSLLASGSVAVAILPSIWPETYGLVVDECLASGVPVVAFDFGAVGERLNAWGTGTLVSLNEGADGLARTILDCLENPRTVSRAVIERLPTPEDAAGLHIALYQRLASG